MFFLESGDRMQAIIDFFTGIIDGLVAIVKFVIDTIKDIVHMVQLVGETMLKIPDLLSGFLPAEVVTAVLLIFGVVVIYKILGREG